MATAVTKTPSTELSESGNERIHLAVLSTLGVDLPETAKILDFGCGAGRSVRALRARGFVNAYGYDVGDGRTLVAAERDHIKVGSLLDLRLPYEDNTFDLVISDQVFEHVQDQVRVFEESAENHQAQRPWPAHHSRAVPPDRGAYLGSVRRDAPASLVVQAVGFARNPQSIPKGTVRR